MKLGLGSIRAVKSCPGNVWSENSPLDLDPFYSHYSERMFGMYRLKPIRTLVDLSNCYLFITI